jgi:ferrous iron transport protein A
MRNASEISFGERAIISDIDSTHPSYQRILEMGFTPGQEIKLVNMSFFNDPVAFSVRGSLIAVRKNDAECIKIK